VDAVGFNRVRACVASQEILEAINHFWRRSSEHGHGHSRRGAKYTKKDFDPTRTCLCPAAGLRHPDAMQKTMPDLGSRGDIVFISGIGARAASVLHEHHGFHTIHGRAPALATGLKLARPGSRSSLITGDGDGLSIGGNHLLQCCGATWTSLLLFN